MNTSAVAYKYVVIVRSFGSNLIVSPKFYFLLKDLEILKNVLLI